MEIGGPYLLPVHYVFRIDAFTPDTLPMSRLAEYLAALAKLIGHADHTHFVRLEQGSAKLIHKIDAVDAPKVENRLNQVRIGDGPKDALAGQREIEELLANDNAVGTLSEADTGKVVIPFVGRMREKKLMFPPFRQDASIQGQIVNIGGRDSTAHATLQDGDIFHTNLSMKRELARELAHLLYGPIVKLIGNGRFERAEGGNWKLLDFRVDAFERLSEASVKDVLGQIRTVPNSPLMREDIYSRLNETRLEDQDQIEDDER